MRLRPPTPEDLEAVFAVFVARDTADIGAVDYTREDLRGEWQLSEFDLAADARVVEDEQGQIVAYGLIRTPGAFGIVAPAAQGRGAGSLLLKWLEQRERELGRSPHRQYVAAANRTAETLLRQFGYELAWSNWRMVRPLDQPVENLSPLPDGLKLRELRPDADAEALHALDARAFAEDPGYAPESVTSFREEHLQAHDLAPGLSRVAEWHREAAGFLLTRRWVEESVGYIDLLAVEPAHQRRGIGRAVLLDAFAACRKAGLRDAQLGVSSSNPRALALYESAGMTARFRSDIYERPV